MMLTLIANPRNSDTRRPSKIPNNIDQTIPKGSPLKNNQIKLYGAGVIANKTSINQAHRIKPSTYGARREKGASDANFTPRNFEHM